MADKKNKNDRDKTKYKYLEQAKITVKDEFGTELKMWLVDIETINGVDYAILTQRDENKTEEELEQIRKERKKINPKDLTTTAVITHVIRDGDEFRFEPIDDDDEFQMVSEYFHDKFDPIG